MAAPLTLKGALRKIPATPLASNEKGPDNNHQSDHSSEHQNTGDDSDRTIDTDKNTEATNDSSTSQSKSNEELAKSQASDNPETF